jgi:hypothetical protein
MELRSGGDASDWFFVAMAHWQLNRREEARTWFSKAVDWMDQNQPDDDELDRIRVVSTGVIGVSEDSSLADKANE